MHNHKKILFFSGAGLSAESGLKTFRDNDGLWESYDIMEVCSAQAFRKNRRFVLDFYDMRRAQLDRVQPNAMHFLIAELQKMYPNRILNLTQNVDDLLERAGCHSVIHLHGTLTDSRCEACGTLTPIGYMPITSEMTCPHCGSKQVRHNIVMFNEPAPAYRFIADALDEAEMLIVIGTSGQVIDVVPFTQYVKKSVLVNPKKEHYYEQNFINDFFDVSILKTATQAVPELKQLVTEFMSY